MLGRDLLIFPDTGDEFSRTLRTAALYAGRVHCLTFVGIPDRHEKFGPLMRKWRLKTRHLAKHQEHALRRLEEYGAFLSRNSEELVAAKEAGILLPLSKATVDDFFDSAWEPVERFLEAPPLSEHQWAPLARMLARAAEMCPPSLFDIELLGLSTHSASDLDLTRQCLFLRYLLVLIDMAEARSLTLTSWSPAFRNFIWDFQRLFGVNESALGARSEARIGQVVFERRLTRVDDLPLEEVLRIRERRQDELEAFRTGLAELAVKLDTTQPQHLVERQINDLVSTRIDPAVRRLRAAVAASRLDSLKRVFRRSWTAMAAKATLPAVLAYFGTGRIEVSAAVAVAALGSVILPFAEAALDKRKLLANSPWSLLLRLK